MANERLNQEQITIQKIAAVTDPGERRNLILMRRVDSMLRGSGWSLMEVQVAIAQEAAKKNGPVYEMPQPNVRVKLDWSAIDAAAQKPPVLGAIPIPYA